MIRIQLDDASRDELNSLRRTGLAPKVRDRVEMVAVSDAGWSAPRIAEHLGYNRKRSATCSAPSRRARSPLSGPSGAGRPPTRSGGGRVDTGPKLLRVTRA